MTGTIELTVASYNIHKGVGAVWRRDLKRITAVIGEIGAEIIALQEVDLRFGTRVGLLELEALNMHLHLVHVPVPGGGLAHGWHGNQLLLREGTDEEVHHLTLPGLEPRGAVIVDLAIRHRALRVVAAHFGLLPASRRQQSRAILEHLDRLSPRPTLMMGDLNEWRTDRESSLAPLTEHFRSAPLVRSFPARFPILALDRIMAGAGAEVTDAAVHDTPLARRASDHLPIKARLVLPARQRSAHRAAS